MYSRQYDPPAYVVFEILDTAKFELINNQIPEGFSYYRSCSKTWYLPHNYNYWTCQSKRYRIDSRVYFQDMLAGSISKNLMSNLVGNCL